jgi:hypothetical protein
MVTSTSTAQVGPHSRSTDDDLLRDFILSNADFFTLATQHDLSLDQLIDWFHSDATQARLRELAELADARAAMLARFHRAAAITRLSEIVEDTRSSTVQDRIRSATQLLRVAQLADKNLAATPRVRSTPADARPSKPTPGDQHENEPEHQSATVRTNDHAGEASQPLSSISESHEIYVPSDTLRFPAEATAEPVKRPESPPHPGPLNGRR